MYVHLLRPSNLFFGQEIAKVHVQLHVSCLALTVSDILSTNSKINICTLQSEAQMTELLSLP